MTPTERPLTAALADLATLDTEWWWCVCIADEGEIRYFGPFDTREGAQRNADQGDNCEHAHAVTNQIGHDTPFYTQARGIDLGRILEWVDRTGRTHDGPVPVPALSPGELR